MIYILILLATSVFALGCGWAIVSVDERRIIKKASMYGTYDPIVNQQYVVTGIGAKGDEKSVVNSVDGGGIGVKAQFNVVKILKKQDAKSKTRSKQKQQKRPLVTIKKKKK